MMETPLNFQNNHSGDDGERGTSIPTPPTTPVLCDILNTRGTTTTTGDASPPGPETSRRASAAARRRLSR